MHCSPCVCVCVCVCMGTWPSQFTLCALWLTNKSRAIAGKTARCRYVSKFTAASRTAFLYKHTSAIVQMLKLHKTKYADFHGRAAKSRRQPKITAHDRQNTRWSILSTIPIISVHLYSVTVDRHHDVRYFYLTPCRHNDRSQVHSTYYKHLTQAAWSLDAGIR